MGNLLRIKKNNDFDINNLKIIFLDILKKENAKQCR